MRNALDALQRRRRSIAFDRRDPVLSAASTACSTCSPRSGFPSGCIRSGARWVQEHFTLDPEQETFDYYGPLNVGSRLNIGYHNEHHDFP